jgi:hypothetical protein
MFEKNFGGSLGKLTTVSDPARIRASWTTLTPGSISDMLEELRLILIEFDCFV